jgi:hypothetical protein
MAELSAGGTSMEEWMSRDSTCPIAFSRGVSSSSRLFIEPRMRSKASSTLINCPPHRLDKGEFHYYNIIVAT